MGKFINIFGNKLKPKKVNEALQTVDGTQEAVTNINALIGATPLETGKTITSELADHETRIETLETAGKCIKLFSATSENPIITNENAVITLPETHPLYGKKLVSGGGYSHALGNFVWMIPSTSGTGVMMLNATAQVSKSFDDIGIYYTD